MKRIPSKKNSLIHRFNEIRGIDEQLIQMFETLNENIKNEIYDEGKIEEFMNELNLYFIFLIEIIFFPQYHGKWSEFKGQIREFGWFDNKF